MATVLSNTTIVDALGLPRDILTRLATEQGTSFQATANQFLEALVNKIVYQKVDKMEFTNPDGLNKNLVPSPMDNVGINIGRVSKRTSHFFPLILERDKK